MECRGNDSILGYFKPSENINMSQLSNSDRLSMMWALNGGYLLDLRDELGISKDITFGLEMEFENANRGIIETDLANVFPSGNWKVVDDGSLYNGGEINSPRLTDEKQSWIDLSRVCDIVSRNAQLLDHCSAHVHIGMHILGNNPKYWANFVKLWMAYENVIFRFLYGEYVSPRNGILEQARPISLDLSEKYDNGKLDDRARMGTAHYMFKLLDAGKDFRERRKRAINFTNISDIEPYKYNSEGEMRTIEFRSPNGTFDPVIWQNNVNLLVHLFMYAKSDKFDEDIVIRRMKQIQAENIPNNLRMYSRIYNEQVIEFVDLIFNNNLDKLYFLKQYIKDGNVSNMSLVKSEPFTRTRHK